MPIGKLLGWSAFFYIGIVAAHGHSGLAIIGALGTALLILVATHDID